jgi:hypothetical protein
MGRPIIFLTVSLGTKKDFLQRIKSNIETVRIGLENDLKMTMEDNFLRLGKSSELEIGSTISLAWLEHIYLVGVIYGAA